MRISSGAKTSGSVGIQRRIEARGTENGVAVAAVQTAEIVVGHDAVVWKARVRIAKPPVADRVVADDGLRVARAWRGTGDGEGGAAAGGGAVAVGDHATERRAAVGNLRVGQRVSPLGCSGNG